MHHRFIFRTLQSLALSPQLHNSILPRRGHRSPNKPSNKAPKPLTNATDLSTHRDDSDITLNVPTPRTPLAAIVPALYLLQVCLGKQFTGGSLFFCNTGVPSFDFKHPMQMPPTFDFQHEVGTAVVHLGRLQHGNPPLTSFISAKNLMRAKHAVIGYHCAALQFCH